MLPTQSTMALSADNPQSIRAYFEKVRELAQTGNPFPVSLSDVWALCYTRKGDAVRALGNDFEEGYDYQSLRKNAKRGVGGTTSYEYTLSLSCMEFFIARKVRAVFNVYREVFHRLADAVHVPQAGLVKLVGTLTEKIVGLESKLAHITERYGPAYEAKVAADANKDVETKIRREQIMMYVSTVIKRSIGASWKDFWDRYEECYNVDVRGLERNQGEHTLDVAIRNGHLIDLWEYINRH